jgi:hypothetical protein
MINIPVDIVISNEYIKYKIDYSSAINMYEIIKALKIDANKILFLETCGSGGIANANDINDIIIFAACSQKESSVEDNQLGNGSIFTEGFVRKINSYNYDIPLTVEILFDYAYNFVIEMNRILYNGQYKDKQHPKFIVQDKYRNFIISGIY